MTALTMQPFIEVMVPPSHGKAGFTAAFAKFGNRPYVLNEITFTSPGRAVTSTAVKNVAVTKTSRAALCAQLLKDNKKLPKQHPLRLLLDGSDGPTSDVTLFTRDIPDNFIRDAYMVQHHARILGLPPTKSIQRVCGVSYATAKSLARRMDKGDFDHVVGDAM